MTKSVYSSFVIRHSSFPSHFKGGRVPNAEKWVIAAGRETMAVAAEDNAADIVGMTLERQKQVAMSRVPDSHRRIFPSGRQTPAVGAKGQVPDAVDVAGHRPDRVALLRVPNFDL